MPREESTMRKRVSEVLTLTVLYSAGVLTGLGYRRAARVRQGRVELGIEL